ncbi:MAG: DUF4235 domain-containing protein [Nocardioidaceae bacterium]
MPKEEPASTPAKILYRPVGVVASIVAGVVASQIFKQVWKHASPGERSDAPKALESEYRMREILIGSAIQGAIFAVVKAAMSRGGARVFQRWTGEWPGD